MSDIKLVTDSTAAAVAMSSDLPGLAKELAVCLDKMTNVTRQIIADCKTLECTRIALDVMSPIMVLNHLVAQLQSQVAVEK